MSLPSEHWREKARCADRSIVPWSQLVGPDRFYPDLGSSKASAVKTKEITDKAKRVCALCPVTKECLTYALRYEEGKWTWNNGMKKWNRRLPWGIWAGHTEQERHRAAIEHLDSCETKKCRPPCRPIDERVEILQELFQARIPSLVTARERREAS